MLSTHQKLLERTLGARARTKHHALGMASLLPSRLWQASGAQGVVDLICHLTLQGWYVLDNVLQGACTRAESVCKILAHMNALCPLYKKRNNFYSCTQNVSKVLQ